METFALIWSYFIIAFTLCIIPTLLSLKWIVKNTDVTFIIDNNYRKQTGKKITSFRKKQVYLWLSVLLCSFYSIITTILALIFVYLIF